jgi:hypothetical protein
MPLAWNEIRIRAVASLLADIYDPFTTPPALVKAHQKLDAAVDALYLVTADRKSFKNDAERVAFLFGLYQQYTSLLPQEAKPVKHSNHSSIASRIKRLLVGTMPGRIPPSPRMTGRETRRVDCGFSVIARCVAKPSFTKRISVRKRLRRMINISLYPTTNSASQQSPVDSPHRARQ